MSRAPSSAVTARRLQRHPRVQIFHHRHNLHHRSSKNGGRRGRGRRHRRHGDNDNDSSICDSDVDGAERSGVAELARSRRRSEPASQRTTLLHFTPSVGRSVGPFVREVPFRRTMTSADSRNRGGASRKYAESTYIQAVMVFRQIYASSRSA